MLTEFSLIDFKSFRNAKLSLGPLTVLIGANAAGKSNAIEALRLLSWLAQGARLSTIQSAVNEADKVVRGRIEDLFRRGITDFKLCCSTDESEWNQLEMQLTIRDGELHITGEQVLGKRKTLPLYTMDRPSQNLSTDASVAYNNFARGGNKPHVTVSDQMAVFVQLESAVRFEAGHRKAQTVIPSVAKKLQATLSNIIFLDPIPARMRDYSFTTEKYLKGDGTNLSSVLHRLWGKDEDSTEEPYATQRQAILSFIQSLPEQDISGLGFLEGPRGEVMLQVRETFGGNPKDYDASLLSDGTLRVLAIAAAMLSAPEDGLVVIEEIDNGVHPSRARHLLDSIRAIAERRKLRVLLSTHNPAMLDALPDAAVPDVVFCYRDPSSGDSKLIQMSLIPDVPELLIQGPLGTLMTSGALERFVKNHRGTEARKKQAMNWLESLKAEKKKAEQ
ncbi:ATP-binding protein [Alcaligenes nematophilus]|uniref:ATP-binding protein n=1 Tax=Alcaligenes nematophilus TaxID=2994643 RepID=A0ABU3MUA4_9BURK|nr:ATP-binding protein [Alcaligenes nematophilus]MDT8504925.1 ATP-binding protein [Alcaligenes nematophilus]MDT8525550.1 ATP-binding protein [Alcaligenes nematophilus]